MPLKVAFFGLGLSTMMGMAAANQHNVTIFTDKMAPSPYHIFLQDVPPQFKKWLSPFDVKVVVEGEIEQYLKNRWGQYYDPTILSNWKDFYSQWHNLYDGFAFYRMAAGNISELHLGHKFKHDDEIFALAGDYDISFITFPLPSQQVSRKSQTIMKYGVFGFAPDLQRQPMVCHSTDSLYYRFTLSVYGGLIESNSKLPMAEIQGIFAKFGCSPKYINHFPIFQIVPNSPKQSFQSLHPKIQIYPLGRWARFDPSIHAHHAYYEVKNLLEVYHDS